MAEVFHSLVVIARQGLFRQLLEPDVAEADFQVFLFLVCAHAVHLQANKAFESHAIVNFRPRFSVQPGAYRGSLCLYFQMIPLALLAQLRAGFRELLLVSAK